MERSVADVPSVQDRGSRQSAVSAGQDTNAAQSRGTDKPLTGLCQPTPTPTAAPARSRWAVPLGGWVTRYEGDDTSPLTVIAFELPLLAYLAQDPERARCVSPQPKKGLLTDGPYVGPRRYRPALSEAAEHPNPALTLDHVLRHSSLSLRSPRLPRRRGARGSDGKSRAGGGHRHALGSQRGHVGAAHVGPGEIDRVSRSEPVPSAPSVQASIKERPRWTLACSPPLVRQSCDSAITASSRCLSRNAIA